MARKIALKPPKTGSAPWPHPSAEACKRAVLLLENLHGPVSRPKKSSQGHVSSLPVLDALIHTILSQNTTGANSTRAFASLRSTFSSDWKQVLRAPVEEVADSIRMGGLANVKAQRIQTILGEVQKTYRRLSLEHLRTLPDAKAHAALMCFDGVGPKTASCVLLFCLGRNSFAVDTHVFRITRRLGWIPPHANREQAFAHLDGCVPDALKYQLHVLLIRHGKTCPECAANGRPQSAPCGPCPLQYAQ